MRKDLISFYEMGSPDNHRRWLDDIQRANDQWLEGCHSYIQWLFPNRDPSPYNPEAPTLDDETIEVFRSRTDLKLEVKRSLDSMIEFYKLDVTTPWWVTKKNHNYLRITRILNTLREFQMLDEAYDFFDKLTEVYSNNKDIIGETTFAFWENAFTGNIIT